MTLLKYKEKVDAKEFCHRCGKSLISTKKIDHYDSINGEPIYHELFRCPVNPIARLFCGHSEFEIDEDGDEIEYIDY